MWRGKTAGGPATGDPAGPADRGRTGGSGVPSGSGQAEGTAVTGGAAGTEGAAARGHHGNRYGRSERARMAVLRAADDLLAERGFAGTTIEGIAQRAGVAKQTIYRWWSSKTDVLMEALLLDAAEALTPKDHADLERELRTHLRRLARFLTRSDPGAVFRALIGQAQHDPEFAAAFRARYLDEQRERDLLPLERAVRRGELPVDLDLGAEVDRLVGPIYYRVLVTGEPVDRAFTDRLVDGFVRRYRP